MVIGSLDESTTPNGVFDQRLPFWGYRKCCTTVHGVILQPDTMTNTALSYHFVERQRCTSIVESSDFRKQVEIWYLQAINDLLAFSVSIHLPFLCSSNNCVLLGKTPECVCSFVVNRKATITLENDMTKTHDILHGHPDRLNMTSLSLLSRRNYCENPSRIVFDDLGSNFSLTF